MGLVCYVNGEFVKAENARVSAFDHGFLYGDGIFESLTVKSGRLFKFHEHLERLDRSAKVLRLELPVSKEQIGEIVKETIRRSGVKDAYIRIIVSRGEGYPVLDPRVVDSPTLVILLHADQPPPEIGSSYSIDGAGLRLKTAGVRKVPPQAFEPRVKCLNYLNNVLARIDAIESGCDEAIILDSRGFVAEAAGENVFVVKSNVLRTPKAIYVLDGITRRTVLQLADRERIRWEETDLTLYDVYTADEVFLTSSFSRVHGVEELDGRKFIYPGPVTLQLREMLSELERTEGEVVN